MANKDMEREFLVECIELYRSLPVLWQVKNKLYHDRDKKNMAYDLLLAKYHEMFPQATKEDLKKKINSLRTNYRKELKKIVNSMKSGANSTYLPTLWYYEEMNFLRDQELPFDTDVDKNTRKRPKTRASKDGNQDSTTSVTSPCTASKYAPKKAKKNELSTDLTNERLNEVNDEYHHWGIACAADLRKMERIQQLYAKKAIAEILMEGQLGLLHRHSVKINENENIHFNPSPQHSNGTTSPLPVYVKPDDSEE